MNEVSGASRQCPSRRGGAGGGKDRRTGEGPSPPRPGVRAAPSPRPSPAGREDPAVGGREDYADDPPRLVTRPAAPDPQLLSSLARSLSSCRYYYTSDLASFHYKVNKIPPLTAVKGGEGAPWDGSLMPSPRRGRAPRGPPPPQTASGRRGPGHCLKPAAGWAGPEKSCSKPLNPDIACLSFALSPSPKNGGQTNILENHIQAKGFAPASLVFLTRLPPGLGTGHGGE